MGNESFAPPFSKAAPNHNNVREPAAFQFAIEQLRIAGPKSAGPWRASLGEKQEFRGLKCQVTVTTNSAGSAFANRRKFADFRGFGHRQSQGSTGIWQFHIVADAHHGR